jgi:hypothetical protein
LLAFKHTFNIIFLIHGLTPGGTYSAITIPSASKMMIGTALILDFDFLGFSDLGE